MLETTVEIELRNKGIVLKAGAEQAYFNAYWLRDNCATSFDPELNERTFDIASLVKPPSIKSAEIIGAYLRIEWNGEL